MGNMAATLCAQGLKLVNQPAPDANHAEGEAPMHAGTQTHMLIIALDYKGTGNQLTCTIDGKNMQQLGQQCGVQDMKSLFDNEGNKANVIREVTAMGQRCQPGDYFIFYYSGHGANVPDKDGDEEDGQDESLCLVTPDGKIDWNAFMTDDDFCELITSAIDPSVKILIICDCCHSGTIGDFSNADWNGFDAVSMTGCTDDQTSGDTGKGGICTHAMLAAIAEKQQQGEEEYSVAQLYNETLEKDDSMFGSAQDITLQSTKDLGGADKMAWPLLPTSRYQAPWGQ